jgi:hypothetical protein
VFRDQIQLFGLFLGVGPRTPPAALVIVTKCSNTDVVIVATGLKTLPNAAGSRPISVVDPAVRRPSRVSVDSVGHTTRKHRISNVVFKFVV